MTLMIVLAIKISALIFMKLDPDPDLKSTFGRRIPNSDPADKNHADTDLKH
jgi:hypothetical protein